MQNIKYPYKNIRNPQQHHVFIGVVISGTIDYDDIYCKCNKYAKQLHDTMKQQVVFQVYQYHNDYKSNNNR